MGVNADGKISLSVGIDEGQIKQSASQIKSILKKEISTINLDQFFDDKKIQQEVQQSIDSINKVLSKSKFKKIDTSTFVPRIDAIMSNKTASEEERSKIISGYSHQFAALDKYGSKDIIPLLSNSKVLEQYMKDLTNVVDFVQSIKGLTTKEQNKMIKDLSKGDADDIAAAFTLKDLQKTYGTNIKYKVKPKDIVPLLQESIENMDATNEEQLKDFLGLFNRGKYLAQVDSSKSGVFRNFFEQFENQYKKEIEYFQAQYPDLFTKMEREVIGMSKDFDNLYNTRYKNKSLDSANLVKGLKTNKTINQKPDIQTEKAPTSAQEVADTVLDVQSDVVELNKKVEKAEELANKAKEAADEVKKEINNTNKNVNKNKPSTAKVEKKDGQNEQKNEQQSFPALEQAKQDIDETIETEEKSLEKLREERKQLQFERHITEKTKTKLEQENKVINSVLNNTFKDESKKENYNRLKKLYEDYKTKKEALDKVDDEQDAFQPLTPEWNSFIPSRNKAKKEERLAWLKYYKAFDVAKNGKNQVANSRLERYNPEKDNLTEFDSDTLRIYIEDLKNDIENNKKAIDNFETEIDDYQKKIDEFNEKISKLHEKENEVGNNMSNESASSFNKSNGGKTTKPEIPIDLQQELGAVFGFDFNDTDESSDITSAAQAEENLREETDGANKALEEQNNIVNDIAKTTDNLVYHMGQINGDKTVLSNIFGEELQKSNEHNIGTGLYGSKSSKDYSNQVLSNEDLDNYYAIDTSELKMYEAHAEETAKEFYDFIHRLEQFCIMMGSGFEGFDDNLENIDEEALYSTAQKLFPNLEAFFNDFDEFDEYINEMITLVGKSGINADGTVNPIKMRLFQKEFGTDDIKTRFLKEMGYQGVNLSGTKYGNNVIFNPLDNTKIVASGKNIEEVIEQAINKVSSKQEKNVEETKPQTPQSKPQTGSTANIKEAIEEQEELEEKTKKATDALKDQQQTLAQSNVKPPSQNLPEEGAKEDDVEKNKTKPKVKTSARVKKPVKSPEENKVKSDSNELNQGEASSANEANNEAEGFKLITGSAEEAAEAKRKFVEANKEVLQSIVASMPKIEQEAKALEKVEEASNEPKATKKIKSKDDNSKTKDRKGYYDFESMPNDLIEQRFNEISPLPVIAKGTSLATDKLDDEVQSSLELLEELHTVWDKGQQEIKDIIYDSTIENMQQEYAESQRPQYDFELDYESIVQQAQKARQYYEDQISNDFEVKAESKLDLIEDETGQLSLFDNILPEENWGQELKQNIDTVSQTAIEGQISFQDLENAIKNSEQAYNKLISTKNKDGKSFIQNSDLPNDFLKTYENISTQNGQGYKATSNLRELKNLGDELKDVKTKLKVSFDEVGNLKSTADPLQVQELLRRYDELVEKIQKIKLLIENPTSKENIVLKIAKDAEKAKKELDSLKEKVDKTINKSDLFEAQTQKTINAYGAFDSNGQGQRGQLIEASQLSDDPNNRFVKQQEQVQELISKLDEYKTAIKELDNLRSSDNTTLEQLKEADDKVKKLKDSISTLSQTIKTSGIANASEEQITKLKSGIELFLEKTPNLTGDIKKQLEDYIKTLSSGASVSKEKYNSMVADLKKFQSAQTSTRTIWEQMVGKMREGIAFLATKFSFYQIFNQFRQGFEVIHQFDDALTEMMKVSDETRLSLERYQKTTFDTADAIGTNALQLQNSTADFMRLGETLDQAAESAKTANVLMNVSEFQSIDEATKSLIALSAAYDDLSKTQIIDKLNEVGNNFSISTSGAAEALQASASALKTAGNDMDEALALVTAGNQVVQDISKAGNGLRTISLRLTGTKSAKEELEELGEDTDSLITTQSKLRDTIKQATAVASNGFKGFDILDDNGNYKSTYEIMLGIAQIYQEILDTDKQFGTNNANLLLETVAGKTRANIAASIFQSPDVLEAAYKSSQDANGSAMRENEKYIQSISGHLAQLQNAWQEMWANAANREVINFFIDAAKAVVNFANAVGVLPTTLALLVPYINIITKAKSGKGIITQFLEWAATLDTEKETVKNTSNVGTVVEETVDIIEESAQRASEAREVYNDAIEDMLDTDMDSKASNEMPMPSYLARHLEEEEKWSWDSLEDKSSVESSAEVVAANEAKAESYRNVGEAAGVAATGQQADVVTDSEEIATSTGAAVANEVEEESYEGVAEAAGVAATGQQADAAADLENAATSTTAAVKNTEQVISQTGKQAADSSSGVGLLSKAFNGLLGAVGPITLAIGAVGIAAFAAWKYYQHLRSEWFNGAKEATDNIKQQKEQMDSQIESYRELKTQLNSGNLSEQETLETKQKIYDIQKQISEQYGSAAKGVDLINGELEKQVDLLNDITQKEAEREYLRNKKGFRIASEEYNESRAYYAGDISKYSNNSQLYNSVQKALTDAGLEITQSDVETMEGVFRGSAADSVKALEKAKQSLENLKKEYRDPIDVQRIEDQIKVIEGSISRAYETIDEYEETHLQGLELRLARMSDRTGYDSYQNYQTAVSDLESAYISGDTKKIQEARQAFEDANKAKNEFLKVDSNNEFSALFDKIDTSLIDTRNKTYDAFENIKKAKEINDKLSRVDDYKQQKKQADAYYDYLGNLQKVGNIDNGDRPFIFWDYKEAKKQEKALESWGESVKDIVGSYSTVYGGSGKFDGVEIAFTPIINDGTGKGKLLNRETLNEYINTLIANAGEGWTNEELLNLDAQGLIIDGEKISNVLASVGSSMSDVGLTSEEVGELMHDWQAESIGYISNFKDEWKEAQKQGKTLDEFMENTEDNLQDTSKATGRYTKEQKNLAKALKEVANLNMDRVDAEMVFDENAQSSQDYKDALYDLLDAMGWTVDDASLLIDTLVDTGYIYGDVNDATTSASEAYNAFSQEVATAVENVSKLNTVLTESVSGANISTQNLDAFKEMFGDDYTYALERTANGYHINAEKLQTLIDKQNALTNTDYQKTLDAQYDALKRCNEEIIKANSEQQDTSGLLAKRQNILQRIQDTNDLMMAYQASTSAYQTWVNAQSNGSEYDMYEKISGGFDTVKDLIDRGWSGDDTVRSFLDLIYGDSFDAMTASGQECAEMFDNLDKKIEGTSFSIRDFFQVDANGKLTSNGIFNFFDAVKEKQEELGKDWLTLDDEGNITDYNFGLGRDRDVAEALGMDVELVQSILRAAYSAGFEVNLDQPMWAMNELQEKAISAQEELEGFNEIDFEELYKHLDDEDAYETISGHIDDVYQFIQDVENSDLSPELKTKQIEQAQDMLSYLVALEREAADRGEIDLKATVVGTATDKISQLLNETEELPDELKEYNWDEITDKNGLEKARKFIAAEVEGGKIDASSAEAFLTILDQALYELGLIDEYEANPTIEGNTVGAYNQMAQAKADLEDYIAKVKELESKGVTIDFNNDPELQDILSRLKGTSELRAALEIDSSNEEILEMLESGETDAEVILSGDTSQLEKDISNATQSSSSSVTIAQNTKTVSENIVTNTTNDVLNFVDQGKEGRESAAQEMQVLDNQEITPKLGLEDEAFVKAKERTEKELEKLDNTKSKPSVELIGLGGVQSVASNMQSSIDAVKGKTVRIAIEASTSGVEYAKEQLQGLINKATEAARAAFTHIGNGANGTAHAQGTAFSRGSVTFGNAYAGGKWGLPKNQTALTGELGTEIVVRDGNWFTVGDDGAEFVNLKKGDIVFNHKQAQELLENGYVTSNKGRGHLVGFANGTAYSNGNMGGATKARVSTSSVGSKSSSKSSSSNSGRSSSGNNNSNNKSNNNNNNAKETKNTLDEVEILIARIERQIANLDKTISNTYTNWTNRNKAISDNLKKVATEIKDQDKAYNTYTKKAASVGLSKEWQNKIKNGAFRIEDVKDDKLWEKINKFKEYWEKALAAKDAAIDLRQKEGELYKQRFDNEQTYYEELIANLQHTIDVMGAYNDQLEESGKLNSKNYISNQIATERQRLKKLEDEYKNLIYWRDTSVKQGKIKKGSEAWEEMQQTINEVSESIIEANTNLITFGNEMRDIDWNRWEKIHDAIAGVNNELEFFYGLINEDDMFDEQGTITDYGTTAFGILAQEYDTYFREVEQYQKEIEQVEKDLASDKYNQALVDKLKDLKEAQQDAASNAKKMKDSMVDVTEQGIKKQIDYVKKLIDDYEDLLETQKDQIDYAKKVADQQKELNKLEKQYRAIQNDTSEESATKRQRLREQINEKRQELQDTQEDRRLSETKDMLSDFEETFEEFLDNKLKDVEGIVHQVIDRTNANGSIIKDTIESLGKSYGYTPSDTLQNTLNNLSNNLASYFDSMFDNDKVNSIVHGVDAIVDYYDKAQAASESGSTQKIIAEKIKTSGSHIQKYTDSNGNERIGYFNDNGTRNTTYTGWAESGGKYYRFENGEKVEGSQFINADGKKYYLVKGGSRYTGLGSIDGKKYYFNASGEMQTGWQTIDGKKYYFDKNGMAYTGIKNIGNKTFYFDKNGVLQMGKWQTVGNKKYYLSAIDGHALKGKQTINKVKYTFNSDGSLKKKGWKKGTASVPSTGMAWTNEGRKAEAIIRKSDGAILTPLNKGDSVIPNSAMKNMYQALTNPAKYLKQYTTPDVKVVQSNNNSSNQPPVVNMQFIANGVQDANRFVNDLMNNKKLEKWVQEVTLGQANGNNNYKKYSYVIR